MLATAQCSKKQQAKKQKTASKALFATTLKSASPEISQTQGNSNLTKKYSAWGLNNLEKKRWQAQK
jgi:flagellar hook-basal body complex protein FliE